MSLSLSAMSFDDPTGGKPFIPWLWNDQLLPPIKNSLDSGGRTILLGAGLSTAASHQYDDDVFRHNNDISRRLLNQDSISFFNVLGAGTAGVGIAIAQIFFDQENGLKHSRALLLTSTSHFLLAFTTRRDRPSGGDFLGFPSSFPSGHTSSAFATATSLSYAYGWKAGIPSFALATGIGLARLSENRHWLSDVVAGAFLGVFWARASYSTSSEEKTSQIQIFPSITDNGFFINLTGSYQDEI